MVERISVREALYDIEMKNALLICAYDNQEKFEANRVQGAISMDTLRSQEDDLSRGRELIFYCA